MNTTTIRNMTAGEFEHAGRSDGRGIIHLGHDVAGGQKRGGLFVL